jgi:hypothetical protein
MNLVRNRNNQTPDTFKSLSRVESIRREAAAELNKYKRHDSDRDFTHTPNQSSNHNLSNASKIASRKDNHSTVSVLKEKGVGARIAITPIVKLSDKRIKSPIEGDMSPLLEHPLHKKGSKAIKKQKTIAVSK